MAKLEPVQLCPVGKVIVHGGFNQMLRIAVRRKLVYMDEQRDWIAAREFLCPTDDKFFRIIIEVSLVERRGVHRVEQLLDSIDEDFDSMWSGALRSFKAAQHLKFQAPERCMRWLQSRRKRLLHFAQLPFGCALERLDCAGVIIMQNRVELVGQTRVKIVTDQFGFRPVNDADSALEPFTAQMRRKIAIAPEVRERNSEHRHRETALRNFRDAPGAHFCAPPVRPNRTPQ